MKNQSQILLITTLFLSSLLFGQVGINTETPGSTLDVKGSQSGQYRTTTNTNYAMNDTDYYLAWDGAASGTVTLPAAQTGAANFLGRIYHIKNTSSSQTLTIDGFGAELLDNQSGAGVTGINLAPGFHAMVISRGTTSGITWEVATVGDASGSGLVSNGLFRTSSVETYPNLVISTIPFGTITAPTDGAYLLSVRWWGITSIVSNVYNPTATSAYFDVFNVTQNTRLDIIEYYVTTGANTPFTFTVNLLAPNVKAGDVLQVRITPSLGGAIWRTGTSGTNEALNPSLLVVKQ